MNPIIKNYLETEQPKITILSDKEKRFYKAGIGILGTIVCDEFFDLPRLPKNKYSIEGLFYEIPYYDSDQLWTQSNQQRFLLVVYKIEKGKVGMTSWCPMRIDFKIIDEKNFSILVYDQSGGRKIKKELMACEDGVYFTEISNYKSVKLSELVNIKIINKRGKQYE